MTVPDPYPRAVISLELSEGLHDVEVPGHYSQAHVVVRYNGRPLARCLAPLHSGVLRAAPVWSEVCSAILSGNDLPWLAFKGFMDDRVFRTPPEPTPELPPSTILICTRDRPDDLDRCLQALQPAMDGRNEIIVVDNNSPNDRTREVASRYPVRYYCETRRGLNWARARGVQLATHEIVLFVDDDAVVEPDWIDKIRRPFLDPHVGAVTGAVEPIELETAGQLLHEQYSSFHRGYVDRTFNLIDTPPATAGRAGAGANMGVRKSIATQYAIFEVELDAGTPAQSGGDFYALYWIIRAGYSIAYVPSALAWHRHRRDEADVPRMLRGYSLGFYCVILRLLLEHKDWDAPIIAAHWFWAYQVKDLWDTLRKRPGSKPLPWVIGEFKGMLQAPKIYFRTRTR